MDDGWFSGRTHDAAGLGDWWPNPDRFPEGLTPLIKRVHELGMQFGLWVEPEMVNPDSELYRAHPDWVIHLPHRTRSEHRNQLVLDVSRPEVADWMHRTIDGLLTQNEIDFLKWDMNRSVSEAGDEVWLGHTRNLYAVLDRLRADHPRVRIESCSGGGARADLGILSRTDEVWTSDNTDALDRLDIQHGFTQIYPAHVMGAWVTDSPNPITGRAVPLDFRFHVAMAGLLGIGGSLTEWSAAELERAKELVALYKRIRPLVQHGELYRLHDAVQYVLDGETVVLAFRPARRFVQDTPLIRLRGLDPDARYVEQGRGRVHHGAVLMSRGLRPDLAPADYSSTMIHLVRE
jgi:alpha-galactosidase